MLWSLDIQISPESGRDLDCQTLGQSTEAGELWAVGPLHPFPKPVFHISQPQTKVTHPSERFDYEAFVQAKK